jgi:cytidine deaminase
MSDFCTVKLSITCELENYKLEDLNDEVKYWLFAARDAAKTAHAPYSNFHVGCSVISNNTIIETGSNQENVSFPSGLCAERVALFKCSTNLDKQPVDAIAIYATSIQYEVPSPLVPCAACLQVISDIENRQQKAIDIWMFNEEKNEIYKAKGCKQFLPFHFELKSK